MSISLQSRMVQRKEGSHKIHILHLINSLIIGGAEILLLHYIQALGFEDYNHYVYSFGPDGPVRKKIEALGLSVYFGPKRDSIKNPLKFGTSLVSLLRDLLNFLRNNRIHIIHSHLGEANQLAVLAGKLSGIPAFPTVHNTMSFVDKRSCFEIRVHINKAVNRLVYKAAYKVVTISQEVKEIIHDLFGLDDSKVIVVKNGIIPGLLPLGSEHSGQKGKAIFQKLKLIGVGSLTYQKAFEVLVRAAAKLVEEGFDDFLVRIAGEGPDRDRLEHLILEVGVEDNVKLLGIRDDVGALLKSSDIFIMPSRYEGLSIAMIEAMAFGLPVIASDVPGLSRYIDQGKNGFLFQVGDHKALAECILLLANNKILIKKLSKGAMDTFEKEYDIRENIKPLNALFRKSVKRPVK